MNRIRELRLAQGWTQAQLGKRINAVKSTISGYENNDHQLTGDLIDKLCDLFGCTADYLLGRSESPFPVISPEDAAFLDAYKALPDDLRAGVDAIIESHRRTSETKAKKGA